jgi:hypothetical protein
VPSDETTEYMLNKYPPNIRKWLLDRGGVKAMTVGDYWALGAPELWQMGYRQCAPGDEEQRQKDEERRWKDRDAEAERKWQEWQEEKQKPPYVCPIGWGGCGLADKRKDAS